jgi:hypothetical protein
MTARVNLFAPARAARPPTDCSGDATVRRNVRSSRTNIGIRRESMSSGARSGLIIAVVAIVAIIAAFAFGLIDINQTKETKLPEVSVQGGQAPTFDVDTAKVDVGTTNTTVDLPKVEVGTTKENVELPTVDVKKAN